MQADSIMVQLTFLVVHQTNEHPYEGAFLFGIVDSRAKLQIIAGSREERAWKGCKKSKNLTSDDALPQGGRYLSTAPL